MASLAAAIWRPPILSGLEWKPLTPKICQNFAKHEKLLGMIQVRRPSLPVDELRFQLMCHSDDASLGDGCGK